MNGRPDKLPGGLGRRSIDENLWASNVRFGVVRGENNRDNDRTSRR